MKIDKLEAISPIDGRYRRTTEPLSEFFSEKALIKYRVLVECEYLMFLSEHPKLGLRKLTDDEKSLLKSLCNLTMEDAAIVKAIEVKGYKQLKPTNHDVKAVEYFLKDKLGETSLKDALEWVHFGLTSEDANNLAYSLMLSNGLKAVVMPAIDAVYAKMDELANKYKSIPMLARTHGQPASPTTFGKEFRVFASRLGRQISQLKNQEILVKMNSATGNYNAQYAAYPDVDWPEFTTQFIEHLNAYAGLKLKANLITTQIEPHDSYAELFDIVRRANTILLGFNQDMWRYISDGWLKQKPVEGEVGSSTMPHKVNPIDFENSEGNLGIANALLAYFSSKLPISRLQRDLSDSTVLRNLGTAFAHCLIAYNSALRGMSKIDVNEAKVIAELENHPEVISEAIQTILRKEGIAAPYELMKDLTRGKKVELADFYLFIDNLNVSGEVKTRLRQITPLNYTGLAEALAGMKND
ncbi:MAG: adenylosuccinate lyase [Nanoarchaeota archaeon]|nr:adenylosuccinate lyase [Nanoarchaeota archaeon]